jgi:hypothetical protein
MKAFWFACLLVGCTPPVKRPAAVDVPFSGAPGVQDVGRVAAKATYKVRLTISTTRDIGAEDGLALVVRHADDEVGRYPITGAFNDPYTRPVTIKPYVPPESLAPVIELPIGDYQLDAEYKGVRYSGGSFSIAEVPYWGGTRVLTMLAHHGTAVDLVHGRFYLSRWWVDESPSQPWIVEWRHEGTPVTTTSGRERAWMSAQAEGVVSESFDGFRDKSSSRTIWQSGEQYEVPEAVTKTPGRWQARVVHGGASPVAVSFTVSPNGSLAKTSGRLEATSEGWADVMSPVLPREPLAEADVAALVAKLPALERAQPFDEPSSTHQLVTPIPASTPAVRALFRSKQLARAWQDFLDYNSLTSESGGTVVFTTDEQRNLSPEQKWRVQRRSNRDAAQEAPGMDAAKKAKLRSLRPQIEQLIKAYGGPWKPSEFPKS